MLSVLCRCCDELWCAVRSCVWASLWCTLMALQRAPQPETLDGVLAELVDAEDVEQVAETVPEPPKLPDYYEDDAVVFGAARTMVADRISDYEEFPWRPGAPRLILMEDARKLKSSAVRSRPKKIGLPEPGDATRK